MIVKYLESFIQSELKSLYLKLWGVEILHKKNFETVLRVYITQKRLITLHDCQYFNLLLRTLIDVKNYFFKPYILEISSPGINRRIFNISQIKYFQEVELGVELVNSTISYNCNFRGVVSKLDNFNITLELENSTNICFSFNDADVIRIIPKIVY